MKIVFNKYEVRALLLASVALIPGLASAQTPQPEALPDSLDVYKELDEFTVSVKKEVVSSDGAKLTYDLDQDPSSKGQSVLDALRKVPMVSVDGDDKIYIKGQSNFKIYVNGREDPMLSANASTVLKAMPAEAVSKIEVINEPGAKNDAEGVAGILNLVTQRKQSQDGYTGNLSATFSKQMLSASAYGRGKYHRVTADASVNYATMLFGGTHGDQEAITINKDSDMDYRQIMGIKQRIGFGYTDARFGLSWDASDRDLFTVGANIRDMDAKVHRLDVDNKMFDRGGSLIWNQFQKGRGNMKNLDAGANASYQRNLDEQGQDLTLAYAFNFGRNGMDLHYANSSAQSYLPTDYENNRTFDYTREHTVTIDYCNPFKTGKHKLEAGMKGVFRRNSAISSQTEGLIPELMSISEESLTRQIQNIYAAYALYNGVYGSVSTTAGIRYEHTYMGMDFVRGNDIPDFRRHLNDWVPNAALSYIFDPVTNLRLAYQMRIRRPDISQLNPFVNHLTATFAQQGNPYLDSERYNNLTLTFSKFTRTIGGSIAIDASQSNNTIESLFYWDGPVQISTSANLGSRRKIGLEGFLNWNLNQKMSFNLSGNIGYTHIRSRAMNLTNHAWNGSYNASWNYSAPSAFTFSAYGGQNTGDITLQAKWRGWYYYGLSISRGFLKEKALTVTLNAQNFLQKYSTYRNYLETETRQTRSRNRQTNWNVGITIGWRFGKLQDRVKETSASLTNDDRSTTKSTGASGGIGL